MFRTLFNDIFVALSLLTRIPIKVPDHAYNRTDKAVWAYFLAGVFWGLTVWFVTFSFSYFGIPISVSAALGLSAGIIATGAMHEDGLADSTDGILGGWDRDQKLEIMKDSCLGVYGTLAIALSTIVRWQLIIALFAHGFALVSLVLVGCLSRSVLPFMRAGLNNVRQEGLSHSVGRPSSPFIYFSLGITVLFAAVSLKIVGLILCVVAVLVALVCAIFVKRAIGGHTGDILGATLILTEIAVLCTLLVLLDQNMQLI